MTDRLIFFKEEVRRITHTRNIQLHSGVENQTRAAQGSKKMGKIYLFILLYLLFGSLFVT